MMMIHSGINPEDDEAKPKRAKMVEKKYTVKDQEKLLKRLNGCRISLDVDKKNNQHLTSFQARVLRHALEDAEYREHGTLKSRMTESMKI
jgi:hypothetical protein